MWIFRPICYVREVWYTITNNIPISGHDFHSKNGINLKCHICGYKSKGG